MSGKVIQYDTGKLPPQAIDIEEAIIGALLIDKSTIDEVLPVIKSPEVFYKPANQHLFESILTLVKNDRPVDMLTVSDQLRKMGKLDDVGGDFHIVELGQKVSSGANSEYHSRILLQHWVQREIIKNSQILISDAYSQSCDIFDIIEKSEKNLDSINEVISTGPTEISWVGALDGVVKRVERLTSMDEGEVNGVTTGFKKLDKFTGGWQSSDLIIIAARPGMGKTALILKNLLEISLRGEDVGMFSLEMSTQQLATRLMAINSHFHLRHLFRDGFKNDKGEIEANSEKYFIELLKVQREMEQLPIHIDDQPGITIHELCMKARMWKRKFDIKALFVDYIQLMTGDNNKGNREQEISIISRKLKHLAKELHIPVIALSQLSRSVENRAGKRPQLSDLRESGAIEQDADVVIFIFRPEYYGFEPEEHLIEMGANTEISFAKYRQGSLATKGLWFDANKTKFMDPEDNSDNKTADDLPF